MDAAAANEGAPPDAPAQNADSALGRFLALSRLAAQLRPHRAALRFSTFPGRITQRIAMTRHASLALTLALLAAVPAVSHANDAPVTEARRMEGYKQEKQVLSAAEREGMAKLDEESVRIVQRYLPRIKAERITAHTLDRAYDAWLADTRPDRPADNVVIPALGVRLGMLTLKTCKGAWYHVKDNYGEALAVEFEKSGQQVYPIESVNKRYERHERDFFADLHAVYLQACHGKLK
jgi:hypothetical protein